MTNPWLITNVRFADGTRADVSSAGGRLADGDAALLLPGVVGAHIHHDKTMWGMHRYSQ